MNNLTNTNSKNFLNISNSTEELKQLEKRIPIVSDQAIIDLINGIQVNRDLVNYHKNRGFFGQLIDTLDGSDRQRKLLLDGNLIAGQETLLNWVLELTDSLNISQVALQITQKYLLESRQAIRGVKSNLQIQQDTINNLSQNFLLLEQKLNHKFIEIEERVRKLELKVTANNDFDYILTAWMAEETYTKLPWTIQVALLAKQIFSSAVINYEIETDDTKYYRKLLVNKIIAHSQNLPKNYFGLADLFNYTINEIKPEDQLLITNLLEVYSLDKKRLNNTPLLFALGTTLELANLPKNARPSQPSNTAIALCRKQIMNISHTTDTREFITYIVEETAKDYLNIMTQIKYNQNDEHK